MKLILVSVVAALFLVTTAGNVFASQKGTKAEAEALVEKARDYIKTNGKEKALAAFNNPIGRFVDGDLYIFAYDFNGVNLANGGDYKLVGKNLLLMQDDDGKLVIKDLIETARKGSGWYDYKWSNPQIKQVAEKSSYVLKIDDELWIGCGFYK